MREENAAAALEVMSRFALDPRWLLYLPPTMSPVGDRGPRGLLEHPEQAFEDYRADGVGRGGLRGEAHGLAGRRAGLPRRRRRGRPGSACPTAARRGLDQDGPAVLRAGADRGAARPRPRGGRGRRAVRRARHVLAAARRRADARGAPRPAQLLRDQYAAVGAAARAALPAAVSALEQAARRGLRRRRAAGPHPGAAANAAAFTAAYRRYCWPTDGLAGVRIAPFQLLAYEGAGDHDRPHGWHLELADRLAAATPTCSRHPPDLGRPAILLRPPRRGGRS